MPEQSSSVKFSYADSLPTSGGLDQNTVYFLPNEKEIRVGNELIASDYTLRYLKENRNNI